MQNDFQEDVKRNGIFSTILKKIGDIEYFIRNHKSLQHGGIVREKLTAARIYYVRTDGSNSNTGLVDSAGGAFLTIQKAVDVCTALDSGGYTITIQVADGTYTGAVTLKNVVGYSSPGNLVIKGNASTPANVLISTTSSSAFTASSIQSVWDIKDLKITTTTAGSALVVLNNTTLRFTNLDFGACATSHILCWYDSIVEATGNYAVSGNAALFHFWFNYGGMIIASARTITFSNSPVFSTFAVGFTLGKLLAVSMVFTNGATVTAKRYDAQMNAAIFVNGAGAAYFPGGTAGTTATGGQYA